jgi:hypothetical protein
MAKPSVENKVSVAERLEKVSDSLTVHIYDNGYMLEISGRNDDGDWKTSKIVATNLDDLFKLIEEASLMPKDD